MRVRIFATGLHIYILMHLAETPTPPAGEVVKSCGGDESNYNHAHFMHNTECQQTKPSFRKLLSRSMLKFYSFSLLAQTCVLEQAFANARVFNTRVPKKPWLFHHVTSAL